MESTKPTSTKRKGGAVKETPVKSPRLCLANDTTLDMDELFNSVIGAVQAVAMDQAPPPPTTLYLGSLQDCIVNVKDGLITISSISKSFQYCTFTPVRLANFMSYFSNLDDDIKELNKKTRAVNTIVHIGDGYHISIRSGILCCDMRQWYVPYGMQSKDCRPGRRGIALRIEGSDRHYTQREPRVRHCNILHEQCGPSNYRRLEKAQNMSSFGV